MYYKNIIEDNQNESDPPEYFEVNVEKSNVPIKISFVCASKQGALHVLQVKTIEGEDAREESFFDFDEELQRSLEDYLVELGINEDFASIVDLSLDAHDRSWGVNFASNFQSFLRA